MTIALSADKAITKDDVEAIATKLEAIAEAIESTDAWDMQDAAVRENHDRIVAVLDQAAGSLTGDPMDKLMERHSLRERLIRLNARLHSVTEIALAKRYLSGSGNSDPFEGSWINRGFSNLLAGQVAQWRRCGTMTTRSSRIAIVGGGALPQTQVFLSRALGCPTVSIDWDEEAADLSNEILARIGLKDAKVMRADGAAYDYADCAIVVVATLVQHKSAIATRIAETNRGVIFSPRTAVGTHAMWREAVDLTEISKIGWKLLDVWTPDGSTVASHAYRHVSA